MIIRPDNHTEAGRAAAAIPGLRELVERLDTLKAPLPTAGLETPADIHDAAVAAAVAGEPVDYIAAAERALAAEQTVRVAQGAHNLRAFVRTQLENRAEMLIEHGVDDALAALADSLDELLDQARAAVADLGGVRTAQDALRAGEQQLAAFSTLDRLASRYGGIRQAQRRFTGTVWEQESVGATLVAYGELRGRDNLWATHGPSGRPTNEAPPWPHNPTRVWDGLTANVDTLIWLVTDERADPWLPSIDELHGETEAARERQLERQAAAVVKKETAA